MIEESNWVPLVLSIIGLFFIVVSLVSFYGNIKTQPWYVSLVCIVGWFFPFWIVLLLPLDMASTLYEACGMECRRPLTWVSQSVLYVAWRTIYWTSFCLTWMLIPMMQAYVNTGELRVLKRLKSAAKVNLRFYAIYVVVGIIGIFYLVFKGGMTTRAKLQAFVMALSNSWGLFLVIMFMGYGLVAVPRKLWYAGDIQRHLDDLYAKAPRVKEECMDSELEFDELAKTINAISYRPLRTDPYLRRMVDDTVKRFPFAKHPDYADRDHSNGIPQTLTEEYIVTLNRNMILAARMKDRNSALWNNLLDEAYYLQDIQTNKGNQDRSFHSNIRPLTETTFWIEIKSRIEWWWVIMFRSIVYRSLAIIFGLISLCILWSELTFNVKSPLISIVGLAIDACGLNYAAVEVLSILTLMWMCICVYTSLFKIRFFNLYLLIPHHHTDPNSLLWFTGYMCKMMAPLCNNYINLLGSVETTETIFSQFMGKANLVPFLGDTFIVWFPVLILIPSLLAFFNASPLEWFGNDKNIDPETGGRLDVNVTEGRDLVMEERRLLERVLHHETGPPPGFFDRAKSVFGAKFQRPKLNSRNTHPSTSNQYNVGTLPEALRQERDKRLEALLSQRAAAHQHTTPIPQSTDEPFTWQSMKSRFGQLFSSTDHHHQQQQQQQEDTVTPPDSPPQQRLVVSSPPSPPRPHTPGRVFGRVTSPSSSRAPSPFQKALAAWSHQTTPSS
ncbi:LMBR1-like membrane protein-domain-containing protein [Chlamydoabsidia padenii]|nr:LMBR1-like membrane protein-domain-containing protein [Chlamydoabsidia padenii]